MTVVHVHGNHVPSFTEGISRNVDSLVRSLRDLGEDAHLAAACNPLEAMNRRRNLLAGALRARRLALQALRDPAVDLVHCHVSLASLALLARPLRPTKPVVVHAWNALLDSATPRARGRLAHRLANGSEPTRLALRGASAIVVSSQLQAGQLERLGLDVPVHRVPNGVDARVFCPATPARRAAAQATFGLEDAPTILYYGHASPWKGVDTLLSALPTVLQRHPQAQAMLSVTGYGGDANLVATRLPRAARRRSIVRGPTHVPSLHAAADIAVLPLRAAVGTACHPNVLLECMAAGLAVVATEMGSIPEVVRHGRDALLVPPNDPSALSDALATLLADPAKARALGRAARATAVERFGWTAHATALRALYHSLGAASPTVAPSALVAPQEIPT